MEPVGTRRVLGIRVHHLVDSVVPVYQYGRAQVQARLSLASSPPPSHTRHSSTPAPSSRYRSGRLARTFARVLALIFFFFFLLSCGSVWKRVHRFPLPLTHPFVYLLSPVTPSTPKLKAL